MPLRLQLQLPEKAQKLWYHKNLKIFCRNFLRFYVEENIIYLFQGLIFRQSACDNSGDDSYYNSGNDTRYPENWKIPGNSTGIKKKDCHKNLSDVMCDTAGCTNTNGAEFTVFFQDDHDQSA